MKRAQVWMWWMILVFCGLAGTAHGAHIVGGNITLNPKTGSPGFYTVCVVLYYDANSTDPNAEQSELTVSFFRKRDNARQQDLRLKLVSKEPLAFTNPGCAQSRNLEINVVKFAADIRLSPSQFADAEGYYLSWERCCRSGDVSNLKGAGTSSLVLYTEFPPLSQVNHSPEFRPANGEILCTNTPYTFESGATDADGDRLSYRLETPFNSTRPPFGIDPLAPPTTGPYLRSEWADGFQTSTPVPGSPSFRLDPQSGQISFTPTQTGLFVYRVVVEEFRNGQKIGEVHRDYQLLVIDCSDENPPPVSLTEALYPPGTSIVPGDTIEVGICSGDTISLKAEEDSRWFYQWQRNGVNLDDGVGPAIQITQEGVYSVVKTFADRCGNASVLGEKFRVTYRSLVPLAITPGPKASICEGSPLDLAVNANAPDWTFQWKKDGVLLTNATQNQLSAIQEPGSYSVHGFHVVSGCVSADTVAVSQNPRPPANLTASKLEFCEGDSSMLLINSGSNLTYVWYRDDFPLPTALSASQVVSLPGLYSVLVTDTATGCTRQSDSLTLLVRPVPQITLDSIPVLCGQGFAQIDLIGTPAGGVFEGKGITGSLFDAFVAGIGSHEITYRYTSPNGCTGTAAQMAQVVAAPRAIVGNDRVILAGDSVQLRSSVTPDAIYEWTPGEGLSNTTIAQPTASPAQSTTYTLRVTTANGCFSESQIRIEVLPLVKIPNGFTPNGDGANDTWILENSEAYPACEVSVFNRWGNRVFSSNGYQTPWNGQFGQEDLPAATYYYVIKLHPDLPVRSGSITIFR
ncbi:gliding motility-associated C-terminal domain-containing protein [Arundinibacter roseus]|uniref:Gliding motility-associated C-terminal domain-containing protein n=1 Tax=Arundinibacter roseus TaxID=2070510 RepID=A0A4R4K8T1_9BACT|nr:gliding motility-associated C-terminal domain-containing protein [Arundinibacter roseus]TDB64147.1 gliding motility-associated C-terminal domain-containing protein [Arundinibacter roseus]